MTTVFLVSAIASIAALAGGIVALRFRDHLHLILGLSAGAVIGAALFDLIPEAVELASQSDPGSVTALVATGFLAYLILDRVFDFHTHQGEDSHGHSHVSRGSLGAMSFCLHSVIDGLAIGLAFQASATAGLIVAVAVVAHRFSDGINTVGYILKHQGEDRHARVWLAIVALAPLVGTGLSMMISVSDRVLALILAIFAGFFLYIGASDLIPEGRHSHAKGLTTTMTIIGALVLYIIVHLAHV